MAYRTSFKYRDDLFEVKYLKIFRYDPTFYFINEKYILLAFHPCITLAGWVRGSHEINRNMKIFIYQGNDSMKIKVHSSRVNYHK